MSTVLDVIGAVVGIAVLVGVLISIGLIVKGRPPVPPPSNRQANRVLGRNLRVWQRNVNKDIRHHGHR